VIRPESETMPEIARISPQRSIGHYRIVSKLGEGGRGTVYRASDTQLHRYAGIKALPEAFARDAARTALRTRSSGAAVVESSEHRGYLWHRAKRDS
jgi:serine/threonine protein kinase